MTSGDNIKEYICECGRIFNDPQAFNGHKSHCKIHLGEEKYALQIERQRRAQKSAISAVKEKSKEFHKQKDLELQKWINEQHRCEHCGKIMTEYYGTGRFCSQPCANSRPHTDESRLKTSESLSKYYAERIKEPDENKSQIKLDSSKYVDGTKELYLSKIVNYRNLKYYTKDKVFGEDFVICPYCGARYSHIQTKHLNSHGKTINDLHNEFGEDYQTISNKSIKNRSNASKESQAKLMEEGRHKGWQSRNIKSYAEQFWQTVLDNNNIEYDDEYALKKKDLGIDSPYSYFLDFLLPNKIDLEIDGKQHTYEDRKEHDKIRDDILEQNGYTIYRIPWINPVGDNKIKVKNQIDTFLEWYNNISKSNQI